MLKRFSNCINSNRLKSTIKVGKFISQQFTDIFLDYVYPLRCPICDKIIEKDYIDFSEFNRQKPFLEQFKSVGGKQRLVHDICKTKILNVDEPCCMKCGHPVVDEATEYCQDCIKREHKFRQSKALFVYKGHIKLSMYRFKYSNRREYAKFFAKKAVERYGKWLEIVDPEVIIPVPMYRKKEIKRGYNQAEVFAEELSKLTGIPVDSKTVKRIRDTIALKGLNPTERKNMLNNAFFLDNFEKTYKRILIVDDIYTTGSTLDAITKELNKAHVEDVYGLLICTGKGY